MSLPLIGKPPTRAGLGLRPELFAEVINNPPAVGFFEVHSENYFAPSPNREWLDEIATHTPIALHGVGLSLGSADGLNATHLNQLKALADAFKPVIVSEHLAWSAYAHCHVPDLLPLPLNSAALDLVTRHINQLQDRLGRQILIENPANYAVFKQSVLAEPDFLNTLSHRTGCGLLVDINNVYVSACNVYTQPFLTNKGLANEGLAAEQAHPMATEHALAYLRALESDAIGQYHLAGHTALASRDSERGSASQPLLIDTHNQPVSKAVWHLFEAALTQHGVRHTLIEWDTDLPKLDVLMAECTKANELLTCVSARKLTPTPTAQSSYKPTQTRPNAAPKTETQAPATQPSLAVFQAEFMRYVLGQSPTQQAQEPKETLENLFTPKTSVAKKVYQNNVATALIDYLAAVYPAVCGVVGEGLFKSLCQHYWQNHPPEQADINRYGAQLNTSFAAFAALHELRYLDDLARFEWALHTTYFTHTSDAQDLTRLPQNELMSARVGLGRSVQIISSDFPLYEIHRQSLPSFTGTVAVDLSAGADHIVVYKHNAVCAERVTPEQVLLLQSVSTPAPLGDVLNALLERIDANELTAALTFILQRPLLEQRPEHAIKCL